jgi:putative ABC transport system permease protein
MRAPIVEIMRDGARGFAGSRGRNRTQAALVVSEITIAFVLLAGAALFIRSLSSLTSVQPGFVAEDLLTMRIVLPVHYRESEEAQSAFFTELDERLGAVPGVRSVARADQMPFVGGLSYPPVSIETSEGVEEDIVHASAMTPTYLKTLGIPLVAGRNLSEADRKATPLVAVVNEAMARKYWPGEDPIGRRIRAEIGEEPPWLTVVGVFGDVKYRLDWDPFPEFYVPFAQWPSWAQVVVLETAVEPETIAAPVREAVWEIDPDVPVQIAALKDRVNRSDAVITNRFGIFILGCLSGLAALLTVVGVYGVLAYTVSQRSHEIGIRMALGAGKGSVVLSVLARGLVMAGIGVAIGVAMAVAFSRLVESLLFAVSPTDPATLAGVALLVAVATMAASFVPAIRATKVDPVEALKQE